MSLKVVKQLTKIEKVLSAFIIWPFIGVLTGLILGALFGGRGGMFFVLLGIIAGVLLGISRTAYLYFKFDPSTYIKAITGSRLYLKRAFIVFLYLIAIYTIVINMFFSVQ